MAFNQNYKQHTTPHNTLTFQHELNISASSSLNTQLAGNDTSLPISASTSGVQSDWVVFEPGRDREADILSNSNSNSNLEDFQSQEEDALNSEDDDDDDDSLLESLETQDIAHSSLNEFNLASGSSANYTFHANDYAQSLQNDDFINTRIDCWRKEQAKVLIDDLYGEAEAQEETSESGEYSNDLLVSWGVDDVPKTQKRNYTKRFYGDDLLKDYSPSEANKIARVTKSLSTSLTRDPIYSAHYNKEASFLYQLSNSANKYTIQDSYSLGNEGVMDSGNGLFWEKDLRSTQSSITADSVMQYGNLITLNVF
ncbi:hypothetical protein WICPIJ_004404 [Wickerhamomyces pijperi]|uniref:Uncharacterized protein n=1 Tax=Wickerhamomyces pijperi TaxID=599730 RepID=A0A9P8TM38_WICPI|nr:hypothetical protein WICPIJ_004404 [Wickerhamomyces pijperi]